MIKVDWSVEAVYKYLTEWDVFCTILNYLESVQMISSDVYQLIDDDKLYDLTAVKTINYCLKLVEYDVKCVVYSLLCYF